MTLVAMEERHSNWRVLRLMMMIHHHHHHRDDYNNNNDKNDGDDHDNDNDNDVASVCRTGETLVGLGSHRMLTASTLGTGSRTTLTPLPPSREMLLCHLSGKRVSNPCRSRPRLRRDCFLWGFSST